MTTNHKTTNKHLQQVESSSHVTTAEKSKDNHLQMQFKDMDVCIWTILKHERLRNQQSLQHGVVTLCVAILYKYRHIQGDLSQLAASWMYSGYIPIEREGC